MFTGAKSVFAVVIHRAQNTGELLIVVCFNLTHSRIDQLTDIVSKTLLVQIIERTTFCDHEWQILFLAFQSNTGILFAQGFYGISIRIT